MVESNLLQLRVSLRVLCDGAVHRTTADRCIDPRESSPNVDKDNEIHSHMNRYWVLTLLQPSSCPLTLFSRYFRESDLSGRIPALRWNSWEPYRAQTLS